MRIYSTALAESLAGSFSFSAQLFSFSEINLLSVASQASSFSPSYARGGEEEIEDNIDILSFVSFVVLLHAETAAERGFLLPLTEFLLTETNK